VVSYVYDIWGKLEAVTGSNTTLGNLNPLRYRGYYYDAETGFYSLQSRYYDPEIGRFINADDTDTLLCSPNELTDKNLFAYCDNNPVMRVDHGGDFWMLIGAAVGAVVGGAVSAISQYATTGTVNWGVVGVNAAAGAISGALASTGIGLVASVGINSALGGATYAAEQAVKKEKITAGGMVASIVAGGIGGAIGGKGANAKGLSSAWKSASKGISRELRRANVKFATKQIAKLTAEKVAIKTSAKVAVGRLTFGAIGNTFARWKFGY
jgi:RHS repeat-associated protein